MTLHDNSLQWIYDNIDRLQETVVALDFLKRVEYWSEPAYKKANSQFHDLAFSFLMVAMGEHIPKTLWSADDYSMLYGVITDEDSEIEITDDQ